jgi:CRP-like cAMP-binding protein
MEKIEQEPSSEFKKNLSILREIRFFSELPMETLKVLAYLCVRETLKAGDYLFRQNDDDGRAFYIISGRARMIYPDEKKPVTVRDVDSGTFLGSLALLGEAPRLFSMQAIIDTTCLIMSREKFTKALEQFPDTTPRILKAVVESVHTWEKRFLAEIDVSSESCFQKIGVSLL